MLQVDQLSQKRGFLNAPSSSQWWHWLSLSVGNSSCIICFCENIFWKFNFRARFLPFIFVFNIVREGRDLWWSLSFLRALECTKIKVADRESVLPLCFGIKKIKVVDISFTGWSHLLNFIFSASRKWIPHRAHRGRKAQGSEIPV